MSQFTDYAENKQADRFRGQASPYGSNLYAALATAADDASITEFTGTGYARVAMPRAPTTWAATQGGTATTSTGSSHLTSNVDDIDFGDADADWPASATHLVLYTALTGGNPVCFLELATPLTIVDGDPVVLEAGSVQFTVGLVGGCSDYMANRIIDEIFRGQAYSYGAMHHALFSVAPSNAGGGTEFSGGGYARQSVAASLAAWSGTQGAGTTVASTGTGGLISNNADIEHAGPLSGTAVAMGFFDASTAGNLLLWANLTSPKILGGSTTSLTFPAGSQTIRIA